MHIYLCEIYFPALGLNILRHRVEIENIVIMFDIVVEFSFRSISLSLPGRLSIFFRRYVRFEHLITLNRCLHTFAFKVHTYVCMNHYSKKTRDVKI